MNEVIALRVNEDFLRKIDELSEKEASDRSTIMRNLMQKGFQEHLKEKATQEYLNGKITFSEAAHRANLTLWEMEQRLINKGFRSSYSIDDLKEEMDFLT
jgi:metal-responsive CopG/Arc/MetJ family transcriptional regulator